MESRPDRPWLSRVTSQKKSYENKKKRNNRRKKKRETSLSQVRIQRRQLRATNVEKGRKRKGRRSGKKSSVLGRARPTEPMVED